MSNENPSPAPSAECCFLRPLLNDRAFRAAALVVALVALASAFGAARSTMGGHDPVTTSSTASSVAQPGDEAAPLPYAPVEQLWGVFP